MAGRHYLRAGGSNYLCLPEEPRWKNHTNERYANFPRAYGVEYDLNTNFISTVNNGGRLLHHKPVPCAVCYASQRSAFLMIPANSNCPVGWTEEYGGYLMSISLVDHSSSYICVDEAPEVGNGVGNQLSTWITVVRVSCGTLPCSSYHNSWELACVVCTK